MYGTILGDIIGLPYEFAYWERNKSFENLKKISKSALAGLDLSSQYDILLNVTKKFKLLMMSRKEDDHETHDDFCN